jgi:anti-anti-sigma regulatory factor
MYHLEIDQSSSKATLQLSGAMTITTVQEIKESFQSALSGTNHLCIDHKEVVEYDLSYMQILISLFRTANSSGKKLSLLGNESAAFKSLLVNCGCPEYSWLATENSNDTSEGK